MKTHPQICTNRPLRHRLVAAAGLLLAAASVAPAQNCPAPSNWFPHSQTPAPNPNLFPGNTTATDCSFHEWAWQEFLYVTQPVNGAPRFLSYPTSDDLFPSNPTQKPLHAAALRARNAPTLLKLRVRGAKPKQGGSELPTADSINQAGSGGILVDHNGNPLYYSVHFDWVFYEFIVSNSYYDYSTYIATNPNVTFPCGATEFKASWMIVPDGTTFAGYTTQAQVPTLSTGSKGEIVTGPPMRNVTVGLVGLHVVGVVANHPEFVWETFEQVNNAPDLPSNIQPTSSSPVSPNNYTFYTANTPANQCNVQPQTYTLNVQAQTLSPITQVFRQFADGGGVPDNIEAIDTLNASVLSQLGTSDIWSNYKLIGGVWLLPGELNPNLSPGDSQLHGSPDIANATMETFVQQPFKNTNPPPNYFTSCFGCHTTTSSNTSTGLPIPPMNMNLSHILTDGLVTQELAKRQLLKK
jgi:hypothetical protein